MRTDLLLRVILVTFLTFVIFGCGGETGDPIMEDVDTTTGIPLTALLAETTEFGDDIYGNYNFIVEIDGISIASFSEAMVLEAEVEVIEYRDGTEKVTNPRKLPGRVKYSNLVLKRGITGNTELFDWFRAIVEGSLQRRNMSIILLDSERQEVARWSFRNAWPCRYAGPSLNALGNEIAIEELEIAHEGFSLETNQ